jgi:hypothetical protein
MFTFCVNKYTAAQEESYIYMTSEKTVGIAEIVCVCVCVHAHMYSACDHVVWMFLSVHVIRQNIENEIKMT